MKTLLTSLVGFSTSVTRDLNGTTRIRLFIAALAVLFVASVSSMLFANTFSNLCFSGRYFWALFAAWFGFTWLLDTVVLMSGGARGVFFVRLGICVLLGLLNSFTADVRLFKTDIHNYLQRNYNAEVIKLDSTFQQGRMATIDEHINDLMTANTNRLADINTSRYRLYEEYNGQGPSGKVGVGPDYLHKLGLHQQDSTVYQAEITRNDSAIAMLTKEKAALEVQRNGQRVAIVVPKNAGLRDNITAMHKMVWGPDGTLSDRTYFVLFFLLGFVLEAMVLIVKSAAHSAIEAYESIAASMSKTTKDGIIQRHEQDEEIRSTEATCRHQATVNRLTAELAKDDYQYRATMSVDEIEGKISQAVREEEVIHEAVLAAQRRNKRMMEAMGDMYEDFGKDLHNRSLAAIRKELDRLTANTKRTTKEPA